MSPNTHLSGATVPVSLQAQHKTHSEVKGHTVMMKRLFCSPDIGHQRVHMSQYDGRDVSEDEGGGGPDDQCHGQNAQALLKPPHVRPRSCNTRLVLLEQAGSSSRFSRQHHGYSGWVSAFHFSCESTRPSCDGLNLYHIKMLNKTLKLEEKVQIKEI